MQLREKSTEGVPATAATETRPAHPAAAPSSRCVPLVVCTRCPLSVRPARPPAVSPVRKAHERRAALDRPQSSLNCVSHGTSDTVTAPEKNATEAQVLQVPRSAALLPAWSLLTSRTGISQTAPLGAIPAGSSRQEMGHNSGLLLGTGPAWQQLHNRGQTLSHPQTELKHQLAALEALPGHGPWSPTGCRTDLHLVQSSEQHREHLPAGVSTTLFPVLIF